MREQANLLMIGAAGRDVGKTEFACEVIRRSSARIPVIGVKVTTITERGGCCPRGGTGCGVCTSLEGNYLITEEQSRTDRKDTSRMLAAGAARVYWLRTLRDSLQLGVEELLRRIPQHFGVVCESNSARSVVAPAVFLVLKARDGGRVKESCRQVIHYADRICEFAETGWDLSPSRLLFASGSWSIREEATAVVLAGGKSSRIGRDKSLLSFDGQPMIQRIVDQLLPLFDEVLIGANDPERFKFLNLRVAPDQQPDQGPLMGIVSCLTESGTDLNFVTACDVPDQNADFIAAMLRQAAGVDVVMPKSSDGGLEPLFALYRKSIIAPARALLSAGRRRIADLLNHVKVKFLDMPGGGWYQNVNTIGDYLAAVSAAPARPQRACGARQRPAGDNGEGT
jgi:molybdopterin-guanine dinucleotide biosynthesis protein A